MTNPLEQIEKSGRDLSKFSLASLAAIFFRNNPEFEGTNLFGFPIEALSVAAGPLFIVIFYSLSKFLFLLIEYYSRDLAKSREDLVALMSQNRRTEAEGDETTDTPWQRRRILNQVEVEHLNATRLNRFSLNGLFFITSFGPALIAFVALSFSFHEALDFFKSLL